MGVGGQAAAPRSERRWWDWGEGTAGGTAEGPGWWVPGAGAVGERLDLGGPPGTVRNGRSGCNRETVRGLACKGESRAMLPTAHHAFHASHQAGF